MAQEQSNAKEERKAGSRLRLVLSGLIPLLVVFIGVFGFYFVDMGIGIEREERQFGRHETTDRQILEYAASHALLPGLGAGVVGLVAYGMVNGLRKRSSAK